jgi:hypothetical protein
MFEAGRMLGIKMLAHIIFTDKNERFFSFRENNSRRAKHF